VAVGVEDLDVREEERRRWRLRLVRRYRKMRGKGRK
jgi:hypothetical protein